MPSLARRRDAMDSRAERLESHIRSGEVANGVLLNRRELPQCSKCKRVFEERSKVCPFCETKTMGTIRPIPAQHLEQARRRAARDQEVVR